MKIFQMKRRFKLFLARREAAGLERRTQLWRRAFRDYRRLELGRIREAAIRARALRLYAAWSTPPRSDRIQQAIPLPWEPLETARNI
jgi:hypothetical protein